MKRAGAVTHQPFGGPDRSQRIRATVKLLEDDTAMPSPMREKFRTRDGGLLADVCLNGVIRNTGINVAVCAIYTPAHIRANAAAVCASRFTDEEIALLQGRFCRELATTMSRSA
jgi:hypothetical protein